MIIITSLTSFQTKVLNLFGPNNSYFAGLDHRNSNQYTAAEATTMTASGTMNTTLPSFENLKQERNAAFQAKLKSFDENDQLGTIREAVAIIEPPKVEENHTEG